jgi:hypothetical protein
MKNNKKVNLAEAAAQVMGGLPAVDMLGKPNMDASGKGSFTATPVVAAAPATLAGIGKPGVPATMSAMAGGAKAAAPVQNTETEEEEVEEETEEAPEEDNKKKVEESFRLAISELLGENVDENLVSKLEAIFEAAVSEKVEMEVASAIAQLDENAKEYLGNVTESLVEKVDDYLDYVVEEWVKENAIAVEQGIKTQIAENFITGLKNLFENHYIDVPAEKYNVLDDIYEQNQKLQSDLNESVKTIIDLKKQVSLTECAGIFVAETKDLADTQITKLQNLMENVSFGTPEEYRHKLVTIKENYLKKPTSTPTRVVDVEETFSKTPQVPTTLVEGYVNAIGRINKKA